MMEDLQMKHLTSRIGMAILLAIFYTVGIANCLHAQGTEEIRFGFFGGANYNMVGAGSMNLARLSDDFSFIQKDLNDGTGIAPYFGAIAEYTTGELLGAALRLSIDIRTAQMEDEDGRVFTAQLSYVTVEPGMRFNLGMPELSLSAGPAFAVNLTGKYDYDPGSGDNVVQVQGEPINGINNVAYGLWGDVGYDIEVSPEDASTSIHLSPFLGVSWLTDQRKSDLLEQQDEVDDVWSTVSIRGGLQVKFGVIQ
jgi:hypothetical protein